MMSEQLKKEVLATRPRQIDVAKAAGVSPSTVSKVLSGDSSISKKIRERVLHAIRELDYPIAELRSHGAAKSTGKIRLVTYYQFLTRENSYFHSEIIHAVLDECHRLGYEILTLLLNRDQENSADEYRAQLAEEEVDAVLFVGIDQPEFLGPVRESGAVALIVNGNDPDSYFESISPALRDGCRMVTRHLIAQGHTEIVHVTHLYRSFIRRRLEGFKDALEEAGLPFSMENNVIDMIGMGEQRFSAERAAEEIQRIVEAGKLKATAIFCVSDYTAFGVIQGLQQAGKKVPDDYAVASFDNLPLAQLCRPRITSAGVDRDSMGRLAVRRLIERIQSPSSPVLRIEVGATLCERESSVRGA